MDETRERRIREYVRWVCKALTDRDEDPRTDPSTTSREGGDNLVDFPATGNRPPRGTDPAEPDGAGPRRRSPGTSGA